MRRRGLLALEVVAIVGIAAFLRLRPDGPEIGSARASTWSATTYDSNRSN